MRKADPELRTQREQQIIEAAVSRFVETGFHQTSMQDVAAASGFSIGLIYRYFESKEAIIARVAQLDREATIQAVDALPDTGDIIRAWARWLGQAVADWSEPGTVRLVNEVYAEAARNPSLQATLEKSEAALGRSIEFKLARQAGAGSLPGSAKARHIALGLLILFDGAISRRFSSPALPQAALDAVLLALVTGLFAAN